MILKLKHQAKKSQSLKPHSSHQLVKTKVLKSTDGDIFVCKQGDKACWQRYTSAMSDCI